MVSRAQLMKNRQARKFFAKLVERRLGLGRFFICAGLAFSVLATAGRDMMLHLRGHTRRFIALTSHAGVRPRRGACALMAIARTPGSGGPWCPPWD